MNNNLEKLRHSCAHLLAAAVLELWPAVKITIGPVIEDGFYYDFDFGDQSISESDLPKIENTMFRNIKSWTSFVKKEVSFDEAKKYWHNNPYKIELIDELIKNQEKITFYLSGNFIDLCRGGHIDNPSKNIKYFKLLSVAGAYWHGDEKNKMLTRIYGTCFPTKKELDEYLIRVEEAKKRDHRKLGKELGLFVFSDLVGKGLPMLTAKGATIRRVLERFIVDEEIKRDYQHVITPPLAKVDLYRTSGHFPYYKDTMYPVMKIDEEELILRPMTCPHHFMLFKSQPRSYKKMPVRYAEISPQFRYEKSGELTGLIRIRMFMLADAHIMCPKDQAKAEIIRVLDLIDYVNKALGLKKGEDYLYRLSLGDRNNKEKYYDDDKSWIEAENILRELLKEVKAPFYEAKNEAAFYGPKIDVQIKNILGKEETAFTVQYDFVMPKRFNLRFINELGQEEEPIVIHRASLGCFERTMAFLIEKYAGSFPLWLAPVQVEVLPISDKFLDYSQKVSIILKDSGLRVELNQDNDTIGKKIRNSTLQKVPYMVIIGEKEIHAVGATHESPTTISVRTRDGKDLGIMAVNEFIKKLKSQIEKYR